jgi:phage portal protein BeeE
VEDIGRIFGVPLYKLQAGKQAYSSNVQNAVEYVVSTVHPNATAWEQELSYKLLLPQDIEAGLAIRGNMMAELRGDFNSRGVWYKNMRETGAFCVDDILALEDMPSVPGGNVRYASLNYVPLEDFRELSRIRAEKGTGNGGDER